MSIWDWQDEGIAKAINGMFRNNLCLSVFDRFLILADTAKEKIGNVLFEFAVGFCKDVVLLTYKPTLKHGMEPPESVWEATFGNEFLTSLKKDGLFKKINDKTITDKDLKSIKALILEKVDVQTLPTVIVAVNEHSISHTLYRDLCSNFLSIRFASMPFFEPFMFYTSMQANWALVARHSIAIADLLTDAESAHVTCPLGTDISFSLLERTGLADTGRLCNPGDFGNLPAGEAFIAPLEGKTNGRCITKWAPGRKLNVPSTLYVENGRVVKLKGDEKFCDWLSSVFKSDKNASNIADLGIGTNDRAKAYDNILEAEKIMGTCHIALGDNSLLGGNVSTDVHINLLIDKPTIVLSIKGKDVTIMKNGELCDL